MPRPLFIFVFVGIAAFVLLLYFKLSSGDDSTNFETVEPNDPVLKQLRLKNPQLEIVKLLKDDFDRIPIYWVKAPGSGPSIMMPRSWVEGDTSIQFAVCDLSEIPHHLRYPGSSEPVCVQITNEDAKVSAFYFATKGRLQEIMKHYNAPPANSTLPSYFYETVTTNREWQVLALVGYKKERL